jgi:hypothetical protein
MELKKTKSNENTLMFAKLINEAEPQGHAKFYVGRRLYH